MAVFRPFQAVRPAQQYAKDVAALPYDVYNRQEARAEVAKHPMSFLRIDRGETTLEEGVDLYAPQVYANARRLYEEALQQGYFIREDSPKYYLYELTMEGRIQTGIVGCASIDDYMTNVIKRHESTLAAKEQDRIRHVDALCAQSGPIFLVYRQRQELLDVVNRVKTGAPLYDFQAEDGVRHRVFVVDSPEDAQVVQRAFASMDSLYIADGHHRAASAVQVGQMRRNTYGMGTGEEEYHYFLAVAFADTELKILDYNRVVRDCNGLSPQVLLDALSSVFQITVMQDDTNPRPKAKGEISMYLDGTWYRCSILEKYKSEDAVKGLDTSLLQDLVLEPILGIKDPKTSDRITFVGGIRGLETLERMTEDGVAFAMYPTSMEELLRVADEGELMPPKSTWFEPKLRSGLFIHEIER